MATSSTPERPPIVATRPIPTEGEPGIVSETDLLRYLDGAMGDDERAEFELLLAADPLARTRLEILSEALADYDEPA